MNGYGFLKNKKNKNRKKISVKNIKQNNQPKIFTAAEWLELVKNENKIIYIYDL
jgi:hypothetical protein